MPPPESDPLNGASAGPAQIGSLSVLGIWLLDAAALDYCPFYMIRDEWVAEALAIRSHRSDVNALVSEIQRLHARGCVVVVSESFGGVIQDVNWDSARDVIETGVEGNEYGFGLTPAGGALWESVRRPEWDVRIQVTRPENRLGAWLYCTNRVWLEVKLGDLQEIVGRTHLKSSRIETAVGYRHSYWKPREEASRVFVESDDDRLLMRVLGLVAEQHCFDVRCVPGIGGEPPLWLRWTY